MIHFKHPPERPLRDYMLDIVAESEESALWWSRAARWAWLLAAFSGAATAFFIAVVPASYLASIPTSIATGWSLAQAVKCRVRRRRALARRDRFLRHAGDFDDIARKHEAIFGRTPPS